MAGASDELSLVFHALADPTRRAILSRLHRGRRPSETWPSPSR
ncbi:hypothetical protein [Agromyces marinus]|nr:hypothetical protein [Agromyces marinus]